MISLPVHLVAVLVAALITSTGCMSHNKNAFTDQVPAEEGKHVTFDMVYVPGDLNAEIKPFYISRTEVTWAMFVYWADSIDLKEISDGFDSNQYMELVKQGLRPSLLLQTPHPPLDLRLRDSDNHPAIGMTLLTARAYCQWVSEQTGKHYRLPTGAEWRHTLKLSGGVPDDRTALLAQAVFSDNANKQAKGQLYKRSPAYQPNLYRDEDQLIRLPAEVGSKQPDHLGLYDLLGNAAEWVEPEEENHQATILGGHFNLSTDNFTPQWRAEEDLMLWNESWPGMPYSRFWYSDHYYQGIRLVCDGPHIE